jgi:phosphoribosylamine--glycine ligase
MSEKINILTLGGGGREHALIHALSKSKCAGALHCAPGNPGIASLADTHKIDPCDTGSVLDLCRRRDIGLVVIGPEAPLAAGVADSLRNAGINVFGPGADGARLESSKAFSKEFMRRHGIPTARFNICASEDECEKALLEKTPPFVIKADGLAAGKGVFLPDDKSEALAICRELLNGGKLGDAGRRVIIEDYLPGLELTVFAVTDGKSFRLLAPSRDHKRVFDEDRGPNTGGMGAYAPVRLPDGILDRVSDEVLRPTLEGLRADGIDYRGVIYMGLMLAGTGTETKISVVEYNARFGDPETQAVLPLFTGDFGQMAISASDRTLESCPVSENAGSAMCVVLTSGGYPGVFQKGHPISGLGGDSGGTIVYHSGTDVNERGEIVTSGGRVLSVVGPGATFGEARARTYGRAAQISFKDMHYRSDIGWSEI